MGSYLLRGNLLRGQAAVALFSAANLLRVLTRVVPNQGRVSVDWFG